MPSSNLEVVSTPPNLYHDTVAEVSGSGVIGTLPVCERLACANMISRRTGTRATLLPHGEKWSGSECHALPPLEVRRAHLRKSNFNGKGGGTKIRWRRKGLNSTEVSHSACIQERLLVDWSVVSPTCFRSEPQSRNSPY